MITFKLVAKIVLGLSIVHFLVGCSMSPLITQSSLDYNSTIEDVSNSMLVINVLRGRDEAPLYFPDLSQIRGSMTASVSAQATVPWGPWFRPDSGTGVRRTAQGGPFSASTNPSFDIAPTNTKQFYQGILNPISEDLFAYYIERYRARNTFPEIPFHMLVAGIDISDEPYSWRSNEFLAVADRWTRDGHNQPRIVPSESIKFGPPLPPNSRAVVEASAAGLDAKLIDDGTAPKGWMQLFKRAGYAICFPDGDKYIRVLIEKNTIGKAPSGEPVSTRDKTKGKEKTSDPCEKLRVDPYKKDAWPDYVPGRKYVLHLRPVVEIFSYLGDLINPDFPQSIRTRPPNKGCPRIPFFVFKTPSDYTRLTVSYRGETYYVAGTERRDPCGESGERDNTMPILALLGELLNLSRDANETPTTKAVQAVGG